MEGEESRGIGFPFLIQMVEKRKQLRGGKINQGPDDPEKLSNK